MNRSYNDYNNQERVCGIFIFTKDLDLLLCHPSAAPKNFWSVPKGIAKPEQKFLSAAMIGTEGTTGIDYGNYWEYYFIGLNYQKYYNLNKILVPFVIFGEEKYDDLKCYNVIGNEKEVDDYKWVPYEDAFEFIHDTQCFALEEIENVYIKNRSWLNIYNKINKNRYEQGFSFSNF